ncbi:hypothetical protein [Microseira sp. BLCC-F43]|jgi:hypothetical protein|uniref:hypothetical protein n=1 Tax=Microseira sp. BLCC-F43 TaxID=3153602 RepID=UPI0035B946A9
MREPSEFLSSHIIYSILLCNYTSATRYNLTASNGTNFVEVYSPGTGLNGYVADFIATVNITSIAPLPAVPPALDLETEMQRDRRYQELIRNHPAKYLGIYQSLPGSDLRILRTRVALWNSRPAYEEDIVVRLTNLENLVLAPGTKLWAKVEDIAGSGALSGSDQVSLWLVAGEVAPSTEAYRIVQSTQGSVTVTATSSIIVPANQDRQLVTIVNRGRAIVDLNYGTSAIALAGIGLNPGASSHVLNIREINYFGAISAIVASGTATVEIMESV